MANIYDRIFKENIEPLQLSLIAKLLNLSLRKIEMVTKTEIEAMPIHYDIETDGLYLEGIKKGIEKEQTEFTLNLWKMQEFPINKMASLVGISKADVSNIISTYLRDVEGRNDAQIRQILEPFLAE